MTRNSSILVPALLLLGVSVGSQALGTQTAPRAQSVDARYYVTLGGVEQYVEIHGASRDLPVLLYLHGGPCMPATPLLRYHQAQLSETFIVVSWDQRGCGRSADVDPTPEDMTVERHVLDAHELTRHLKGTLGKEKLLLVGHSWGSVLGVELAQRYPEDYMAYVGVGQVVNVLEGDRLAREELLSRARARGDTATVRAVRDIAFSPQEGYGDGLRGFLAHRRLLWMYQMMDYDPSAMLQAIAAAEGYSTSVQEWMTAALYAQGALFDELMAVDFTRQTEFQIPVFFFVGRHDFNTPGRIAAEYLETLDAPAKGMFWFDQSGHSPPWEEPDAFRVRLGEVLGVVDRLAEEADRPSRERGARPRPAASPDFVFLDGQVAALMEEWGVPGLSVAIVVDGEPTVLRGYGVRELGRPEPVDEHTVFAIASATKTFTAAALGILADEGLLRWDDLVAAHLPGVHFRDPRVMGGMTVRDVLSHQTGYDRHDALWHAFGYTRGELVERLGRLEPSWGLRERFGYQNLMYVLAGAIVESVSGLTWDRFVEQRILRPLGMGGSATGTQRRTTLDNVATPHARDRQGMVRAIPWRDADNVGPAGGMVSSAADMAEWLKLHLARGTVGGVRILSAGTVMEMQTPQVSIRPSDDIVADFLAPGGEGVSYGLGWYVHEYGGHTVVEHPGGIDGMSPMVTLVPALDAGIVILTNISMPTGVQFALRGEILDALLGIPGLDWPAETRSAFQRLVEKVTREMSADAAREVSRPPTHPLARYAGTYTHGAYGSVHVLSAERGLAVRFGQRGVVSPLVPVNGETFLLVWESPLFPPERCTFELEQDGRIRAAVFTGMGRFEKLDVGGETRPQRDSPPGEGGPRRSEHEVPR